MGKKKKCFCGLWRRWSKRTLTRTLRRNIGEQTSSHRERKWLFNLEAMENNFTKSHSHEKQPAEGFIFTGEEKKPMENISAFVNQAAIAWHERRKKWVGDQSQKSRRVPKDPVISWSTTYEDLLSTSEPFSQPIPLPEMVDFLVDVWYEEGMYD